MIFTLLFINIFKGHFNVRKYVNRRNKLFSFVTGTLTYFTKFYKRQEGRWGGKYILHIGDKIVTTEFSSETMQNNRVTSSMSSTTKKIQISISNTKYLLKMKTK